MEKGIKTLLLSNFNLHFNMQNGDFIKALRVRNLELIQNITQLGVVIQSMVYFQVKL